MTTEPNAPLRPTSRRRWLTYALVGGGVLTATVVLAARPQPRPAPPPQAVLAPASQPAAPAAQAKTTPAERPRVELVFALDTTGSMSGLIEGAKRKIWSLASFVARGQPTPDLRVGLIAYRDVGDAYVTRVFDLDDDLDRVYARLRQFRADGGGDTPEHVARALHEAVHKMSWDERPNVVKLVYLVGDAPPHTDYEDGFDYAKAAKTAARKGIEVHTIRCGNDPQTEVAWRRIASLGRGQFLTIGQDGGMRDRRTPFDDELARLHDDLSGTALGYGAGAGAVAASTAAAMAAPAEAKAARAGFMAAKGKAVGGRYDLVEDLSNGAVELHQLKPEELPVDLRGLSIAEQQAKVGERAKKRDVLLRRISDLTREREKHLEEADGDAPEKGFDDVAKDTLRRSVKENKLSGFKL